MAAMAGDGPGPAPRPGFPWSANVFCVAFSIVSPPRAGALPAPAAPVAFPVLALIVLSSESIWVSRPTMPPPESGCSLEIRGAAWDAGMESTDLSTAIWATAPVPDPGL
jgi:hypothetical protein